LPTVDVDLTQDEVHLISWQAYDPLDDLTITVIKDNDVAAAKS